MFCIPVANGRKLARAVVVSVMKVAVPKEATPDERRVALVPELVPKLTRAGLSVCIQQGAGIAAGFDDRQYTDNGAQVQQEVLRDADILLTVCRPSPAQIAQLRQKAIVIGLLEPFSSRRHILALASANVTAFAMELLPRIARAQAMDSLSAMSTIAGYKAVLLAANHLGKFFPLLMTAAGTVPPARVFVIGAGVAGLEAIGTAKRLGAIVEAYDTRPAVKEEIESVGGTCVNLGLATMEATDKGGYAKGQTEEFYKKQQESMATHVSAADVVITAALVRGQQAPVLITEDIVRNMRPGSVIVDLAADQGGNCSLTLPGREIVKHGVAILGPLNLPSTMPYHASQLYARTLVNFLLYLFHDGTFHIDRDDPITSATLLTHAGEIVSAALKKEPVR